MMVYAVGPDYPDKVKRATIAASAVSILAVLSGLANEYGQANFLHAWSTLHKQSEHTGKSCG